MLSSVHACLTGLQMLHRFSHLSKTGLQLLVILRPTLSVPNLWLLKSFHQRMMVGLTYIWVVQRMSHRVHSAIISVPVRFTGIRKHQQHSVFPSTTRVRCFGDCIKSRNQMEDHNHLSNVTVIADPDFLHNKISAIRMAGPPKLQVIADFDATLTRYWINGSRGQSSHGLLQQDNAEYNAKRQALYDYYHPLEFYPTIPIEEKTKLMEEWYDRLILNFRYGYT